MDVNQRKEKSKGDDALWGVAKLIVKGLVRQLVQKWEDQIKKYILMGYVGFCFLSIEQSVFICLHVCLFVCFSFEALGS